MLLSEKSKDQSLNSCLSFLCKEREEIFKSRCCAYHGAADRRRRGRNNSGRMLWSFGRRHQRLVFVPTAALRQEGTSYHYLPPSREIELDAVPVKAICKVLERAGLNYDTCKTWTTEGFYWETRKMVRYRRSEGYSVVEMECASMAACAKMRGILFGQVLFTADSLSDVDAHDIRNWGMIFCSIHENCNGSDNRDVIRRIEKEMYAKTDSMPLIQVLFLPPAAACLEVR